MRWRKGGGGQATGQRQGPGCDDARQPAFVPHCSRCCNMQPRPGRHSSTTCTGTRPPPPVNPPRSQASGEPNENPQAPPAPPGAGSHAFPPHSLHVEFLQARVGARGLGHAPELGGLALPVAVPRGRASFWGREWRRGLHPAGHPRWQARLQGHVEPSLGSSVSDTAPVPALRGAGPRGAAVVPQLCALNDGREFRAFPSTSLQVIFPGCKVAI